MTDRELMQVALHALDEITGWQSLAPGYVMEEADEAKNFLRERLARPEQEPVAWISKDRSEVSIMVSEYMIAQGFEPLYTAPPKREWVGLTDDEIEEAYQLSLAKYIEEVDPDYHSQSSMADYVFVRAIEAKLKEKNNG